MIALILLIVALAIAACRICYKTGYSNKADELYDDIATEAHYEGYDYGYKEGLDRGLKKGITEGRDSGYKYGFESGKEKGYEFGFEAGKAKGHLDGKSIGFQEGYESGKSKGYRDGKDSGFNIGKLLGLMASIELVDAAFKSARKQYEPRGRDYASSPYYQGDSYNPGKAVECNPMSPSRELAVRAVRLT